MYTFVCRDSFVPVVRKVNKNGFSDCVASMPGHIAVGHGAVQHLPGFHPAETRFSQLVTRSLWV